MELQYVFGNPVKKSNKKLGTRKKSRKLKKGGAVKKKRKFSAKQIAAQKKFAAMARARAKKARANPKRRKKKNPTVTAEVPVYKKVTKKWPGKGRVEKRGAKALLLEEGSRRHRAAIDAMTNSEILEDAKLRRDYFKSKRDLAAAKRQLARLANAHERGEEWYKEVKKRGGRILSEKADKEDVMANPRKKRRRKARKHSSSEGKLRVTMNPKKKKGKKAKKHKKAKKVRRRRKGKNPALLAARGSVRITKKARKSFARKKRLNIRVAINPDFKGMAMKYGVAALGGAAYPWFNYGVNKLISLVDKYATKGALGTNLAKIDNLAPGLAAPTISLVACVAVKELDKRVRLLDKVPYRSEIHQALDIVAILSAAGMGMAIAEKFKATPAGMGLSGVRYFPGAMSGADFGQLEHAGSKADFGGVKFFPKSQMSGVEFFQDGARGDEMYSASEQDDVSEAEGMGLIPEGMGSADFGLIPEGLGVIPEGMGGDEGQMG